MSNAECVRRYKARNKATLKKRRRDRYKLKERAATLRRKSTPEGWAKAAIPRIKHRAAKTHREFNLEWCDIIPPRVCPVLGVSLVLNAGATNRWSPSIDRFDNSRGYVRGNVRVISKRANALKSDATPQEIRRLAAYMEGFL